MGENKFKHDLKHILEPLFRVYFIENKASLGMPDLLISRSDYLKPHIWIELKFSESNLRPSQILWMKNNPGEIILVGVLMKDRVFFLKHSMDMYKTQIWDEIHSDQWPKANKNDIWDMIFAQ